MNKKGTISFYLMFTLLAMLLLFLTAIFYPIASTMASGFYAGGDEVLAMGNESISLISDPVAKAQIQSALAEAQSSQQWNIEFYSAMFKYSWLVIGAIIMLLLFIQIRRSVDYGMGGIS